MRSNIMVNAVAGSGKTTTIIEALKEIPSTESVLFLAFNRAIADEIKSRIADLNLRHVTVATFHSRGFYEIRKRYPNVSINKQKMYQYLNTMKKTWTDIEEVELDAYCGRVERLVNMFRFALPENQDQILELCEKHEIELFANEIDRAKEILNFKSHA